VNKTKTALQMRLPFIKTARLCGCHSAIEAIMHWATIDRPVIFGFLTHTWRLLAGLVTLVFIAKYLTPEVQGYYFTFGSILLLQVFVELGLGRVIIQFASHEWADLCLTSDGRIAGQQSALSRLASLFRFSFRWYSVAGAIVAFGVGTVGYLFFGRTPHEGVVWVRPWFLLSVLSGVSMCLSSFWFVLEGCNQLRQVYFYKLIWGIVLSLSMWAAMFFGANLWIAPISLAAGIVWGLAYLLIRYRRLLGQLMWFPVTSTLDWKGQIWPMQWRIALSWISGYFCFVLFTPVAFHYHGPVEAGRVGMTLKLVSAVSMVATAIITPKGPRFGILIAKREYRSLDHLFWRVLTTSSIVVCIGSLLTILLVGALYSYNHPFALRMLSPLPTGLFLLASVLMAISSVQSTYLRAHRREPFFFMSVASAVLVGLSTWFLGSRYGSTAMAAGYLAVVALFGIPCGTFVWYRCRSTWHTVGEAEPAQSQSVCVNAGV
jgi:O-antigen/teichoic acid export membrane protein